MEPEPDAIDLSALDPRRTPAHFARMAASITARALEARRFRRVVVRRGLVAVALAAAAAIALWVSAPHREPQAPPAHDSSDTGILGWATRDASADEVLGLGGPYAH